jgi:hypothetical protein
LADRDRYRAEVPAVPAPDAIVVSGDIIQGVPLGAADPRKQLDGQYQVAEEFLGEMARRFLGDDRSRIVIVPGNHDVDWNTALSAMKVVSEPELPEDLPGVLFREFTEYRWNWDDRKLYRIEDFSLYERRMDAYWDFIGRFYAKTKANSPTRGSANLVSLHDGAIQCSFLPKTDEKKRLEVRCDILHIDKKHRPQS